MKPIYATDLDRTVIYSKKFREDGICVEEKDGKPITYMTEGALSILDELKEETHLIPVTTRSIEQFKRVKPFQECEWAITTNGGTILHNGEIFQDWEDEIAERLKDVDYPNVLKSLGLHIAFRIYGINYYPQLVNKKFYYLKLVDDDVVVAYIDKYLKTNMPKGWTHTIQGRKLYIMPTQISKEAALAYLIDKIGGTTPVKVITSGDGKLDVGFILLGDVMFAAEDSDAERGVQMEDDNYETFESSLDGGEVLLEEILEEVEKMTRPI